MKTQSSAPPANGFTRIDLVALAVILWGAAFIAAPSIGNTRAGGDVASCYDHNRQLAAAWTAFTLDNNDTFPASSTTQLGDEVPSTFPWALGYLDWSSNPANTNAANLTDPRASVIAEFLGRRKEPFKCPADRFLSAQQVSLGYLERVRSVAGNGWLGAGNDILAGPSDDPYIRARKFSQLLRPPPSQVFTFFEEHPDSMNDCTFYPPGGGTNSFRWWDFPGNYHDGAGMLAFADGHAELHRWIGSVRTAPVYYFFNQNSVPNAPEDPRYLYLRTPKQVR
jgi:prepilin-type processing-associated H-X9-DG protein